MGCIVSAGRTSADATAESTEREREGKWRGIAELLLKTFVLVPTARSSSGTPELSSNSRSTEVSLGQQPGATAVDPVTLATGLQLTNVWQNNFILL